MSNQNTVTRSECQTIESQYRDTRIGRLARAYLELLSERDELRSQKAALESQLADLKDQLARSYRERDDSIQKLSEQLAEAKASIGTILIERETAKEQLAEAWKAIDEAGKLSTGWKHGNEGIHLLKIQSILSGHGEAIDAAGALRAKPEADNP